MIEANPSLKDEIIEVYQQNREQSPQELLASLNGPGRVQSRGFRVTAEQLVAIIVDAWQISDNSRWVLYDIDMKHLASRRLYGSRGTALDEAGQMDNVIVLRLDLP